MVCFSNFVIYFLFFLFYKTIFISVLNHLKKFVHKLFFIFLYSFNLHLFQLYFWFISIDKPLFLAFCNACALNIFHLVYLIELYFVKINMIILSISLALLFYFINCIYITLHYRETINIHKHFFDHLEMILITVYNCQLQALLCNILCWVAQINVKCSNFRSKS